MRLLEQKSKNLLTMNSGFDAAKHFATMKHCFAVVNLWVAFLSNLLRQGEAAQAAAKELDSGFPPLRFFFKNHKKLKLKVGNHSQ